jgi:hypothetical protein
LERAGPEFVLRELADGLDKTALFIGQGHKHAMAPTRTLMMSPLAAITGPGSTAFLNDAPPL